MLVGGVHTQSCQCLQMLQYVFAVIAPYYHFRPPSIICVNEKIYIETNLNITVILNKNRMCIKHCVWICFHSASLFIT